MSELCLYYGNACAQLMYVEQLASPPLLEYLTRPPLNDHAHEHLTVNDAELPDAD